MTRPALRQRPALTLALAVAAILSACHGLRHRERALPRRPNLLLVYADDHAQHAISAYGSVLNRTPNIDRLAEGGVLFASSFVGNSICAPARATVLTGLHSHANGVLDNGAVFDGEQRTFPKLLQAAGYQTALVGKWHLKSDPTGFDHWEVLHGQGPYYNPRLKTPDGSVDHEGYTTDVITDRALDWLEHARDPSRPFLLMYQHKAPHREWSPGPEHLSMYDGAVLPEPATLFDDGAGRASGARTQEMTLARHLRDLDLKFAAPDNLTEAQRARWDAADGPRNAAYEASAAALSPEEVVRWRYQRYIKDYLRTIASIDDNLGRVLDWLDASGLADETVVVYSSDQGFYLGDHGWYDKRWMYEESLRMPLIVKWPGVTEPGSVDRHLVQNLDYAETFLELAGLEVPADMQGRSLLPLLRGEGPADWRESIYYHYYAFPSAHMVARHDGVRTERFKLLRFYQFDAWEFYDLERDPDELRNEYANPEYAEQVAELKRELERLRSEYAVDSDLAVMPEEWQAQYR